MTWRERRAAVLADPAFQRTVSEDYVRPDFDAHSMPWDCPGLVDANLARQVAWDAEREQLSTLATEARFRADREAAEARFRADREARAARRAELSRYLSTDPPERCHDWSGFADGCQMIAKKAAAA